MEKSGGQEDWQIQDEVKREGEEQREGFDSSGPEETVLDDRKMQELQTCLQKLKAFIRCLQGEQVDWIPACVENYCGPSLKKRIGRCEEALELAEKRVNKMIRNKKIKKNWNGDDINLLVWLVCRLMRLEGLADIDQICRGHWQKISSMIPGSSWQTCKFRWLSLKKFKLVTHKWNEDESKLLSQIISDASTLNWKEIAQRLYELNNNSNKVFRTGKQCRQHWNCFLNPSILKGPWSSVEDRRLLQYVLELQGSKKWSEIAKYMEGRTENALKNRFNLLITRQRNDSGNLTQKRLIRLSLNRLILEEDDPQRSAQHRRLPNPIIEKPQPSQSVLLPSQHEEPQPYSPPRPEPIVPSVSAQPRVAYADVQFGNLFQGFYGYVGSGNDVPNGQSTDESPRGLYFTYLFPNRMI